ncbi:hypothetical protein LTR17_024415 [Elasticomyces elasticus]|nr:hypothetical protein LTR17_024415 [Elasticomyces elasticus]
MAGIGNITKAGWLYEGNYPEWEERMKGIRQLTVLQDPRVEYTFDHRQECFIITTNISPFFFARIPDACRSNNFRLERAIKRHARIFPLLSLPAEVRLQVYGHFFDYHVECMEGRDRSRGLCVNEDGKLDKDAIPYILAASQAIRREALPVFISHSTFFVNTGSDKIGPSLCRWTKNGLKSGARLLRNVRIPLRYEPDEDDFNEDTEYESWWGHIDLSLTPQKGLHWTEWVDVGKPWLPLLEAHLADVEESRKALNLEGEAIIMALTTRPELWKPCHEHYFVKED